MRIILRILAVACWLWTLLPFLLLFSPSPRVEPDSDIRDAERILLAPGDPNLPEDKLLVDRVTLIHLKDQAKLTDFTTGRRRNLELIWISAGFSFIAGVSLFALSRRAPDARTAA